MGFLFYIEELIYEFIKWSKVKIDVTKIGTDLWSLEVYQNYRYGFFKDKCRELNSSKPEKLLEEVSTPTYSDNLKSFDLKKVFIVHGHDELARMQLSNMLKDQFSLSPIVLQEQPNASVETIISKIDRLAQDCGITIVLMTPDDKAENQHRARQNVILELGYFLGKFSNLSERKIIVIKKGNIEIPSDIQGVIYMEFHNHIKELYMDLQSQLLHWNIISQ